MNEMMAAKGPDAREVTRPGSDDQGACQRGSVVVPAISVSEGESHLCFSYMPMLPQARVAQRRLQRLVAGRNTHESV